MPVAAHIGFVPSGILTLLTDFGLQDPFVGVMHGVVAGVASQLKVIDLTHGILPQDVGQAEFWLSRSFAWFPPGTVHVAVVDPGVGTERAMIVVEAHQHAFVAPDNGLLATVAGSDATARVFAIDVDLLGLELASATFHGRDVFAPVGARIAAGLVLPEAVGPPLRGVQAAAAASGGHVQGAGLLGTVMAVDHFGNLITDIDGREVVKLPSAGVEVELAQQRWPLKRTYGEAAPGEVVGLVNSFGTLEVAVVNGNAAQQLGVGRGAPVSLHPARF